MHRELTAAVMALAEPYRSAVLLRYLDGLTGPEVAARLGLSHAAARQRIARGLAALRADLDARHGGARDLWVAALPPAWLAPPVTSAAAVPTLTTLAPLFMQSKLILSLVVVAAIVATLALRARDGGPSGPPTAPASPSVAVADAATGDSEAGGVGFPSATERAAAGPARTATLALVDETGAARSGCVVFLRERGGWRVIGNTDAYGHVAVGAVGEDVPEPCELTVARRDLRATRVHVERAALTNAGDVTQLVVPSGSCVQGKLRVRGGATLAGFVLALKCDRAFESSENKDLAEALRVARPFVDTHMLTVDVEAGSFRFEGLTPDWTGVLELPEGWRFAPRPPFGDLSLDGATLLLLEPRCGLELELLPPRAPLRLVGRVVAEDTGAALAGVEVRAFVGTSGNPEAGNAHATTDERGLFSLETLAPEGDDPSWRLVIGVGGENGIVGLERALGAHALPDDGDLGELRVTRAAPVAASDTAETGTLEVRVVGDGGSEPLGFQLRVGATQWPFPVASDAQRAAALELAAAASDTDGVFGESPRSAFKTIVKLESGVATLTRLVPGVELELTVTDWVLAPLATRRVVTPRAGTREVVELRVPSSASSIARVGRVVDESGRGLPHANVRVELGRTTATWNTDADGRFTLPFGDKFAHAVRLEVSRPGFITHVQEELSLPAPGEELVIVLERGRELLIEVVDATGRAVGDCTALVTIGPRTLMPTGPYDRGRIRYENAPLGAGEARVELGGLEFMTPFDAAAHEVRCVVPETGTVVFTLDPARIDRDMLAGRVSLALVLQSDREGASIATARFETTADGALPRELTLVAGRYSARLERRRGGAGLPRVEGTWPVADVLVTAGERVTRVVP